ncbi:hypothetical protein OSTOST_19400, partial [Ostertagia ostertagi]
IICPALLMHLPLSTMFFMLFTGIASPPFVDNFVGIAMALYPLMGPIITVVFVKDYRNVLLTTLHIGKSQASTVAIKVTHKATYTSQ